MMSLENFKNRFLKHCKNENIIPQDFIVDAIKHSFQASQPDHYILILSEKNLTYDICKILSECFRHDKTFVEIMFNDCMLSPDCLQLITEGLSDNKFCTTLNLKGNNIKNQGCEVLSRFIRQNTALVSLSLEWNQVGISTNGFQQFCDSLSDNKTLQRLDMRNNQIGYDNCQILVDALCRNDCLRELDLQYNSIGVAGGKEILKIFDKNRTLSKVLILGNNVPMDIMKHIETLASKNADINKANDRSLVISNTKMKSQSTYNNTNQQHTMDLLDKIDQQDMGLRMSDKKSFSKIIQLEHLLDDRKQKCHQLNASLKLAESKLEMYEKQFKEMEIHFRKSLKEREYLERQCNLQLDKEKDFRMEMEKRFLKEQSQLHERILQLQNKVGELEMNTKQQNDNVLELKDKISTNNSEQKLKHLQLEENNAKLKDQHKRELNDITDRKDKELQRMKQECNVNEEMWRDKLSKHDESRNYLNEELVLIKSQMASDKITYEANIHQIKQKFRNDEEQKTMKHEEQLRALQLMKDEIESQNARQYREIENLQKDNSKLKILIESLKIKKDNLEEELSGKQSEMMSEIEKVRLDWMHRVQKLESERQSQADLFTKIDHQDKQINDMKNSFREELHSRNKEIQFLQDKTKSQEMELNRRHEDEKMRACALQSAILQYCQPSIPNSYSPNKNGD